MAKKKRNQKPVYVDRDILKSKAYRTLKRTRSVPILYDFLARRQMAHKGRGGKKKWICTNNGEIVFPFSEAKKLGYSPRQFNESRKELVEHGFIDIADHGGIWDGDTAKYAISERWRKYGSEDFIFKTIPKDTRKGRGWAAFHEKEIAILWDQVRKRKKLKIKRRN